MAFPNPPRYINKFGRNSSIAKDTTEDVWDGGGTYTFTASGGAEYFISSSNNGDHPRGRKYEGLSGAGIWRIKRLDLVGQTKTALGKWFRSFRIKNLGASDFAGTVYIYENDTVTAGVPDTASKIRAQCGSGNQTLMALLTIPDGYRGYIKSYLATINRDTTGGEREADIMMRVRFNGGVFRDQEPLGLSTRATSALYVPCDDPYPSEEGYDPLTDIKWQASATVKAVDITVKFQVRLIPEGEPWTPDVSVPQTFISA